MSIATHPGPTTWDEVQSLEPDGHRYESFAGVLTVTPAPSGLHQRMTFRLAQLLADAAPADLEVLPAPYDWWISPTEWYQPDVMVLRRDDFNPTGPLRATPLLAVEVSSPSTRLHDLNAKRAAYAANRCPHYWIVDPEGPSVLILDLDGEEYQEVTRVIGAGRVQVAHPFPVTFTVRELVGA